MTFWVHFASLHKKIRLTFKPETNSNTLFLFLFSAADVQLQHFFMITLFHEVTVLKVSEIVILWKNNKIFEVNTWLSWLLKALNDSLSQSSVRLSPNDTGMWGNLHSAFNSRPSGVAQWLGKNLQWIVSLWKENWMLIDLLGLTLNCSSGCVFCCFFFSLTSAQVLF